MAYDAGLGQHKNMARGNGIKDGDCRCPSLASVNGGSGGNDGPNTEMLSDSERTVPKHKYRDIRAA